MVAGDSAAAGRRGATPASSVVMARMRQDVSPLVTVLGALFIGAVVLVGNRARHLDR